MRARRRAPTRSRRSSWPSCAASPVSIARSCCKARASFARNGLLYLPLAQLEQLSDRLTAAQPLLGLLHARFDGAAVLDVAARTLGPEAAQADDAAAAAPLYSALTRVLDEARTAPPEPLAWAS